MGASAEPRDASARRWKAVALPPSAVLVQPDGGMRAHGCRGWATPCRTKRVRATSWRSAGINKVPG